MIPRCQRAVRAEDDAFAPRSKEASSDDVRLRESVTMLSRLLRAMQYGKPSDWPKLRDVEHALRIASDILANGKDYS